VRRQPPHPALTRRELERAKTSEANSLQQELNIHHAMTCCKSNDFKDFERILAHCDHSTTRNNDYATNVLGTGT